MKQKPFIFIVLRCDTCFYFFLNDRIPSEHMLPNFMKQFSTSESELQDHKLSVAGVVVIVIISVIVAAVLATVLKVFFSSNFVERLIMATHVFSSNFI